MHSKKKKSNSHDAVMQKEYFNDFLYTMVLFVCTLF